jgi:hypothetical protein
VSIPEVSSRSRLIAFLQGALKKLNSLTIGDYTFPTSDGTEDQVLTTDGAGTLTFEDAGGGGGAPTDAQYVTLATDGDLSAERVLTAGTNISLTNDGTNITVAATAGGDVSVSGTPSNNEVPTWTDGTTIKGEGNLTFDGSTLTVTGDTSITGDTTLGNSSTDTVTFNAKNIVLTNVAAMGGTDDTVLVYNGSSIVTDEIDSKVWAGDLVDYTGTPANNQVAIWTDTDTLEGDANLTWNGSTLDVAGALTVDGNTTLGDASGDTVTINAGTVTFGTAPEQISGENTVLIINSSNEIKRDDIDSKVWSGDLVDYTGTPVNNQLAIWTDTDTLEGDSGLTFDGATFLISNDAAKLQVLDTNGGNYAVTLLPGAAPKVQFGDTDSSDGSLMEIGSYSSINNIDTQTRDFHLYGTNTTTGLYFDESAGKFGIGTTAPTDLLTVATDASSEAVFSVAQYNNSTAVDGPNILLKRARGTMASPTIVQDDDNLGSLRWYAYDGTDFTSIAAGIMAEVDGTPGANDTPGRLLFRTAADGSNSLTERMRIASDGLVTIAGDLKVGDADIYGQTDGPLRLKADTNMYFDCDDDADGAGHFYWRNGANTTVAELDESGDLVVGGILQVKGDSIKSDAGPTIEFSSATAIELSNDLTVTGDYLTTNGDIQASNGTVSAAGMQLRTVTSYIKDQSSTNRIVVQSGGHVGFVDSTGVAAFTVFDTYCATAGNLAVGGSVQCGEDTSTEMTMGSGEIQFFGKGDDLMELTQTGVGIRGATPIAGLAVTGDIEASGDLDVDGVLTVGDGDLADGNYLLKLNSDRAWAFIQYGNGSGAALKLQNVTGPNKNFIVQTNGETRFYNSSGVEKFVIENSTGDTDSAGTKNFNIEHPLKSGYRLRHTSIEGPLCDLIYRGRITLDGNEGVVDVDSQFGMTIGTYAALTKNPQVFLQNSTGWSPVRVKSFSEGILTIESQSADNDEVCWMVVATRRDTGVMESNSTDENGDLIVEFENIEEEPYDEDPIDE